jgi:hypothetical protein
MAGQHVHMMAMNFIIPEQMIDQDPPMWEEARQLPIFS